THGPGAGQPQEDHPRALAARGRAPALAGAEQVGRAAVVRVRPGLGHAPIMRPGRVADLALAQAGRTGSRSRRPAARAAARGAGGPGPPLHGPRTVRPAAARPARRSPETGRRPRPRPAHWTAPPRSA